MPLTFLLTPAGIASALIVVNVAAFAAFGIDKVLAEQGAWRIRESTLLTLAFFGGSPGAYAGRAMFRHKTRKQPFNSRLFAIVVVQALAAGAAIGMLLTG